MKRLHLCLIVCLAANSFFAASCKESKRRPDAGENPHAQKTKAAAPTLENILSSVPCKLDDKSGGFALFPKNQTPGQWCFSLTDMEPDKGPAVFDIQSNEMYVVFHDPAPRDPGSVKLVRISMNPDQTPCLDSKCMTSAPSSAKPSPDASKSGWHWLLSSSKDSLHLSDGNGHAIGIMVDGVLQNPVFK